MYGFTPTISDDHLLIVGYSGADMRLYNGAYKIPVGDITASIDQHNTFGERFKFTKWTELTAVDHWHTALVPSSSPPVVVGGDNKTSTPTAGIKMYDNSNNSWKKIGSSSSARNAVAVAAVYYYDAIGGCTLILLKQRPRYKRF